MKQTTDAQIPEEEPKGYIEAEHDRKKREMQKNDKPTLVIDDDEMHIWSGFVTRNKQHRVCVDAYTVSGENNDTYLTDHDHNLNISHRTNYEDVTHHKVQGVVVFVPQNET